MAPEEAAAAKPGIKAKIAGGDWAKPVKAADEAWAKAPATPDAAKKGPWSMPAPQRVHWGRVFADGHYGSPRTASGRGLEEGLWDVGKNLFGGQMTTDRMYQARQVTKESVQALHASLQTIPSDADLTEDPAGLKGVTLMRHQVTSLRPPPVFPRL